MPCLSALIPPTRKEAPAGRHPRSTWRALCGAVHVVVIGTTRSLDTVPDWLNYRWYTPLAPSVRACVPALGDTGPQTSLILLRMSLVSVVTPSGRLQHLTRCERTKLVLDTQVKNQIFSAVLWLLQHFGLVCASHSQIQRMPFHQYKHTNRSSGTHKYIPTLAITSQDWTSQGQIKRLCKVKRVLLVLSYDPIMPQHSCIQFYRAFITMLTIRV